MMALSRETVSYSPTHRVPKSSQRILRAQILSCSRAAKTVSETSNLSGATRPECPPPIPRS